MVFRAFVENNLRRAVARSGLIYTMPWNTLINLFKSRLNSLIAPEKATLVTVTLRLIVRVIMLEPGQHCITAFRDFLLMSPCSHLPRKFTVRPLNCPLKPVSQSRDNRKGALTTSRELRSDQLAFLVLSVCSYSSVDTRIFVILANFRQFFLPEIFRVSIWNLVGLLSGYLGVCM